MFDNNKEDELNFRNLYFLTSQRAEDSMQGIEKLKSTLLMINKITELPKTNIQLLKNSIT